MFRASRLFLLLCLVLSSAALSAQSAEEFHRKTEDLIDSLTTLDSRTVGIDSFGMYSSFMADDTPAEFEGGLLGPPPPSTPPMMRELVRRGPAVLPELMAHLSDQHPTKLQVGNPPTTTPSNSFSFMWMVYGDEYDRRDRSKPRVRRSDSFLERPFKGGYTVKVGDVCFALIGQIVNRSLTPVRYQPTAGLIVNSPIETPKLIDEVKKDWGAATSADLQASLLADLRSSTVAAFDAGALARLRFYYPDVYTGLQGSDLKKKTLFERKLSRAGRK